jgi:hypothetical protein
VRFLRQCAAESVAAQAKRFNMKIGFLGAAIEIGTPSLLEASFGLLLGQLHELKISLLMHSPAATTQSIFRL